MGVWPLLLLVAQSVVQRKATGVHTLHYGTLSMIAEALEQWFDARRTCLTSVDVDTPFADQKGSREHQSARFMGDRKTISQDTFRSRAYGTSC
jgi:hypothetical protein